MKMADTVEQRLDIESMDTFYNAMRPVLFVSQFFGILPLRNTLHKDVNRVHFKWFYPQALTTYYVILSLTMDLIIYIRMLMVYGEDFSLLGEKFDLISIKLVNTMTIMIFKGYKMFRLSYCSQFNLRHLWSWRMNGLR